MPEQAVIADCVGCYQHENSRTSAVSDSGRSTSIVAGSVPGAEAPAPAAPATSRWRLAISLALSQHTVVAHRATARMPLRFVIYRMWRPGILDDHTYSEEEYADS